MLCILSQFLLNFCVYIASVKPFNTIVHFSLFLSSFANFASYIFRCCYLIYTKLELLCISGGLTFYHYIFLFFSKVPNYLKYSLPVTNWANTNNITARQLLLVNDYLVCFLYNSILSVSYIKII